MIHDVGYMASGMTGSLEALVVCDEIVGMVKRLVGGFELNEETLAVDLTGEVGPAGHFMEKDHTMSHFREVWYPGLFSRSGVDDFKDGTKDILNLARRRVTELLNS